MRGRITKSTNRPTPNAPDLPPANTIEPTGPEDERFVYHLTEKARRLLEEQQGEDGEPLYRPVAPLSEVREAVAAEDRREKRRRLREAARNRGRRFATISHRTVDGQQRPFLRLSGQWLRETGFDVGQHFEVEADRGRLVIETV